MDRQTVITGVKDLFSLPADEMHEAAAHLCALAHRYSGVVKSGVIRDMLDCCEKKGFNACEITPSMVRIIHDGQDDNTLLLTFLIEKAREDANAKD